MRSALRTILLASVAVGSGSVMGSEGSADAALEPRASEAPEVAVVEAELPVLEGTWRLDFALATEVHAPLLGKTHLVNHQATLARISRDEDGFTVHQQACGVRTEPSAKLVETQFPSAFVAGLPQKTYPLRVYRDGRGWRVEAAIPTQHLGYEPAVTSDGRPPQELGHASVRDTDEDGHPGVTVVARAPLFGEVELFLAQTTTTYSGRLQADGSISGTALLVDMEQWVLGASNRLFHRNLPVRGVTDGSSFRMTRLAQETTCSSLRP